MAAWRRWGEGNLSCGKTKGGGRALDRVQVVQVTNKLTFGTDQDITRTQNYIPTHT